VIGRQVSHFYIIRSLGSGGMGVVYEAQDTRLPRSVAIKFLTTALSRNVDAVRRFKREARLAASLNHPNICTILDVDEGEGQCFIAMELLHGNTLKARLAEGPMPLAEILDVAAQVADALSVAHGQGIIHRDITPGNVFVTHSGLVKLLDFGLAKHFESDGDGDGTDDLTVTGAIAGTIHYMAPERLVDDGPVDYRCDLFSLGVILYQMATGTRPFDIGPRSALIAAIKEDPHVPVRQLRPGHPAELGQIIDRLLAKQPDSRYETAMAVRADLDRLRPGGQARAADVPLQLSGASVAVLPFEIIGTIDETSLSVRDGLAEDISTGLSGLRGLRVAPRTSTRAVVGQSIREIGRSLGVDMVLEGTVQRTDDRLRVIANLVDAAHERSVRPRIRIDRRVDEILTTQTEIARDVCDGLAASLSRASSGSHTQDSDAYHAFKRARHYWRSCFAGGWRQTLEHLQYAIDRDPRFAQARVALANAYNFLGFYCLLKPSLAFGVASREAELALTIDGTLASAYVELALAKLGGEWDWDGSERAFRQALALDPADPLAHVHYSWLLALLGRHDAAQAEAQKGHAVAPSSRLVACARAQTLYLGARYEEVIEICNDTLRVDPQYAFALHLRGLSHLARSRRDPAVADLETVASLCSRAPFYLGLLGRCYGLFGMRDLAMGLVAELQAQARETYVAPQCYVYIYAGLGEPQRALDYQAQAYEDGASPFNYLTPHIRDLYALEPYHKTRLEQMRLVL
jgi:TolB-like protein/tRNA A-37 threonylcarbamoyl transferase component Bud32